MLEFYTRDLLQEAEALKQLASDYLDAQGCNALENLIQAFNGILYTSKPGRQRLEVPDKDGKRIRTKFDRKYEPGGRSGGHLVAGELSFAWEVEAVGSPSAGNRTVRVSGNASTKVRIIEAIKEPARERLMAQWEIEMGTSTSPGCFFHFGISHTDPPPTLFKGTLSVPRLPSILVTPTDALDFLLGELFQTEWQQRNQEDLDEAARWGKLQGFRLKKLLKWQHDQITEESGSAWNRFKHRREPPRNLFLRE